jgi:hypothetical protein
MCFVSPALGEGEHSMCFGSPALGEGKHSMCFVFPALGKGEHNTGSGASSPAFFFKKNILQKMPEIVWK